LMYDHRRFVTSVRGIGEPPTTAARSALGVIGFMKAGFGARLAPERLRVAFLAVRFLAVAFFAPLRAVLLRAVFLRAPPLRFFDVFFADDLRAELFFRVAIDSPGGCQGGENACPLRRKL
jgi:hypothetical protein